MPEPQTRPVRNIPIQLIEKNPNNPRLIFDQEKLDELVASIKERGILVPINVFVNPKKKFTIIDGERRYKAALQIGIKKIPVLISDKAPEEYVLDMFHIHHLFEPWELIPTAMELNKVIESFKQKKGREPKEKELKQLTSLTASEIRRCKLVLTLDDEFQDMILEEEARTSEEKSLIGKDKLLTEDFFIETAKNLVEPLKNNNRSVFNRLGGNKKIFKSLIEKRKEGLIKNIVAFRPISKWIREAPIKAGKEVEKFINSPNKSVEDLIIQAGLEFDFFKFERNMSVFLGALDKVPTNLPQKQKEQLRELLQKVKRHIDKKLKVL